MNELKQTAAEDARSNGQPHAAPHPPEHGNDPILQDLPRIGPLAVTLIAFSIIVLLGGLFVLGWIPHERRESELRIESDAMKDARPMVQIVQARKSPAASDLTLPADIFPMQETAIQPRANGYLKTLLVDIGDHVSANQLLAEIDTPEIDAQLEQAKAALQQANVNVGRATNEFSFNQGTFARYEGLAKTGGVTQQQLDEKRAALNIATSSLNAAKASVAAATADVQRYTELQKFEKVLAPFDGVITARNYDRGALLSPSNTNSGRELFRIAHTDSLKAVVNVPQGYAVSIRIGQNAEAFVRNYPGRPFAGTVARSAGALDQASRTLRFEVDIPNTEHLLFPGMYAQVKFQVRPENPSIIVPTSALVYGADGMKIAVVEAGKVRFQRVALGRDFGTEAEVAEGLSGSEQIISNPGERLNEGSEVRIFMPQEPPAPVAGKVAAAR